MTIKIIPLKSKDILIRNLHCGRNPAPAHPRSRALHHVVVSDPVMGVLLGPMGVLKPQKGGIGKLCFCGGLGCQKSKNGLFWDFTNCKNRVFDPYFGDLWLKLGGKCLYSCLKQLMNICGMYTDYIWGFLKFSYFLTLWRAIFGPKSVKFDPLGSKMTDFDPK